VLVVYCPTQHYPIPTTEAPSSRLLHTNNINERSTVSNQLRCPKEIVKED
jgi:hypothetical protein